MTAEIDFTAAHYLGLVHPSRMLPPWDALTTGVPAALREQPCVRKLTERMARLQGCEGSTLATSTLHLFWDLFGMIDPASTIVLADAGLYAVGKWGVERAKGRGANARSFAHHEPDHLSAILSRQARTKRRPIVACCGFCPDCGRHAPIRKYMDIVRRYDGLLIVDDTQATGVFGRDAGPYSPYGSGGGGTLEWFGRNYEAVMVVSSLAKGFGVPIASLAGSKRAIAEFKARSETRVHCSPPSNAALSALSRSLNINANSGDGIRRMLYELVRRFKRGLLEAGLFSGNGFFPIQTVDGLSGESATRIHRELRMHGVNAILRRDQFSGSTRLSFIITARHTIDEIDRAIQILGQIRATFQTLDPGRTERREFRTCMQN